MLYPTSTTCPVHAQPHPASEHGTRQRLHTRSAWRRCHAGLTIAAVGTAAWIGLAGTAAAHTGAVTATCQDGASVLTITLDNYNAHGVNTVNATDGAVPLVTTTFTDSYHHSFTESGAVPHTYTVTVHAFDDPTGAKGFSFTDTATTPTCTTTTTTTAPTTVPTTTAQPTSAVAVPAATTTSRPAGHQTKLANTGANPTPWLIAAGLLLLGGIATLAWGLRRSPGSRR